MGGQIPEQFNGAALGGEGRLGPVPGNEVPFEGMVVDESMLEGTEGRPPLTDALTETLGEQDEAWRLAPYEHPSRWPEKMAKGLGIELFAVQVLPEGAKHVRQQRLH